MPVTLIKRVPRLPKRRRDAHKGDFGRVLVVGGSRGMVGAPALAALASLRSGCGLACVAVPEPIQLAVAGLVPCATSLPLPATSRGQIAAIRAGPIIRSKCSDWPADVVALGPGMDRSSDGVRLIGDLLNRIRVPIVLDADGLNNAAMNPRLLRSPRTAPLILTPHPGEAGRLLIALGLKTNVRTNRPSSAIALAAACRAIVVLKGHDSIVTDGRRVYVNRAGNPGMATGGAGDVLTGVIAALMAQKLDPFDAAVLGTFVHGRAGDIAARRTGEVSLIATDVIDALPEAFKSRF